MEPLAIPAGLRRALDGWRASCVYAHVEQQSTWRLERNGEARYLKLLREGRGIALSEERTRLAWAAGRLPVARALDHGTDDGVEWLMLTPLPGADATVERWRTDIGRLVDALGRGLRAFHETPVDDCPFDFRLDRALEHVRTRLDNGAIDAARDFHPEFAHLSPGEAVALLEESRPAGEDLVVCHGDYCAPNALLEDWVVTGYLDLGELGVADRWWDVAVATWSVSWNYGPGWEDRFLRAYGVELDAERTAYYRLLYDCAS